MWGEKTKISDKCNFHKDPVSKDFITIMAILTEVERRKD